MQRRTLGKDLEVSAIGLGCMSMTSAYVPAGDKNEMIQRMRTPHDKSGREHHAAKGTFSAAALKEIDGAVSKLAMQGERLPEAMLKMAGRQCTSVYYKANQA